MRSIVWNVCQSQITWINLGSVVYGKRLHDGRPRIELCEPYFRLSNREYASSQLFVPVTGVVFFMKIAFSVKKYNHLVGIFLFFEQLRCGTRVQYLSF